MRVVVCGGDAAAAAALRAHAELAARRPHDAPPLRFYLVPVGGMTVARHLAAADPGYAALFGEAWAACCERAADNSAPDQAEMSSRIARYLNSIGPVNNVPIGEAMVAYRERSGDEDASQTFVPFVALEEGGSPPARPSPPATPAPHDLQPPPLLAREPLELQLDYWLVPGRQAEGADGKVTVKASFRALHVTRQNAHLCITYLTKEKKQKMYIDGTEWNGVKFFQLSTQWQTHVKTFPVATCGAPLAPPET
ncbi:hypothetical protein MSG28_007128 [Choristoneura fumiferana]|uniref:Uncharacterized protein n=1 Tax=Choristoneura fumiferana TaxID=7141 RepID=A0ACC0JMP8_CHOFU|nr:hypothetical protein MSG28_007128 [Choristoneura fumiferana]